MSSIPIYTPYVYLLKFIPTNQFYIGVKYSKADPTLFWRKYFTSSKTIHSLIKVFGKSAFEFRILKTFNCPNTALLYEQKLIRRLRVVKDSRFFNLSQNNPKIAANGYIFITDETENIIWNKDVPIPTGFRKGTKYYFSERGKGSIWVNDGTYEFKIKGEIPHGYHKGRILTANKGRLKCYNKETHEVRFYKPHEIPDGYIKGNPPRETTDSYVWLYNEETNKERHVLASSQEVFILLNVGYQYGRLASSTTAFRDAGSNAKGALGKVWVNNGIENTLAFEHAIPDGYVKGVMGGTRPSNFIRKELTCPHCNYTGRGEANMKRWHFDNCKSLNME